MMVGEWVGLIGGVRVNENAPRLKPLKSKRRPALLLYSTRERLVGAAFRNLTGFYGYLFAQGYPCLVAHEIVCPGIERPAAERLLFTERIVSPTFG
jgi:hypothetical protein